MLPKYSEIMDLMKKGATMEAQEKIMELRAGALELQEENLDLKAKIKELEAALKRQGELIYEKPSYWIVSDNGKDGPFCQRCYDVEQHLVRLQGGENDSWNCKSCKSLYRGPKYVNRPLAIGSGEF
ncbi:hypothetical protein [Methylosarcina fibrata]|uniref:hypothetical protein n=1 Tax=Methylosarcina fibrata TaxID=105972 RepID=UPI00036A4BC7|nr:hypothetical protein [Methylosarcina fibrata]